MKKEEIHLWDINRILFGEAPPIFLLEVLIRTLIVYIAVIIVMQWLGKRMNAQLSILEFAVMLSMGAILSVPMQLPDRGILQGMVALLSTLLFLRGINLLGFKYSRFEKLVQGDVSLLIKDSIMQLSQLDESNISKQQLFAALRGKNIYHLGKVKRMYIEGGGTFSIYMEEKNKAGLAVIPSDDFELLKIQKLTPDKVCMNCGWMQPKDFTNDHCLNCEKNEWVNAIE